MKFRLVCTVVVSLPDFLADSANIRYPAALPFSHCPPRTARSAVLVVLLKRRAWLPHYMLSLKLRIYCASSCALCSSSENETAAAFVHKTVDKARSH
jgi:hypothetical protein